MIAMDNELPTPLNRFNDAVEQLPEIPEEQRQTAHAMTRALNESMWANGRRPTAVVTFCLYLAGLIHDAPTGERIAQSDIDDSSIMSGVWLRENARDVPQAVLDNADDTTFALVDDPEFVRDRLETFAELYAEGSPLMAACSDDRWRDPSLDDSHD